MQRAFYGAGSIRAGLESAPAGLLALLLGLLSLPWFMHAAVVLSSALGASPLAGRASSIAIAAGACAFALAWSWQAQRRTRSVSAGAHTLERPLTPGTRVLLRLLIASGLASFGLCVLTAASLPIVAYDALWYRVPVIAQWLDAGRITWVMSDDPVRNGYPLGQEAVSAVVAAATGSLQFADVTSFAFTACGALSIWILAEVCGVRRSIAAAAAAVFVLAPMMTLNAGSGYVDAAFAGATVALLCNAALLTAASGPTLSAAAATGMAAAHVLALKGTGLGFVGLVAIAGVARVWMQRARTHDAVPAARASTTLSGRATVALLIALAAPGAFWTLRDLLHTGNPLWPVEIRFAGHTLLPGVGTMDEILDVKSNTPAEFARIGELGRVLRAWLQWRGAATVFDQRMAGLGWAWPLIALPALAACVIRARQARRHARAFASGHGHVVFVLLLTAACFALQPMRWWARYTLWLWGAGALAIAIQGEALLAARRLRAFNLCAGVLAACCIGEGAVAIAHANGAALALRRWSAGENEHAGAAALFDPRHALNAAYWVPSDFWSLGLDRHRDICRGAWKPNTDDAILDGVFAQLTPRPRVHVVPDDDGNWPRVRRAFRSAGCSELLLLEGSPVLPHAARDARVSVQAALAFDRFFIVREQPTWAAMERAISVRCSVAPSRVRPK